MARKKTPREKRTLLTMPLPTFTFGNTLDESVKLFGASAVHSLFRSAAVQQLRDYTKVLLNRTKNPMTPDDVQEHITQGGWKPGERRRGKSTTDKIEKLAASLTEADRLALLEKLQAPRAVNKEETRTTATASDEE